MLLYPRMTGGRGRIITCDEWEAVALTKFLADAGFEVTSAGTARSGSLKVRGVDGPRAELDIPRTGRASRRAKR